MNVRKSRIWFFIAIALFLFSVSYLYMQQVGFPHESFNLDGIDPNVAEAISGMTISTYLGRFSQYAYFTVLGSFVFTISFILKTIPSSKKYVSDAIFVNSVFYEFSIMVVYWIALAPWAQPENRPYTYTLDALMHGLIPIVAITYLIIYRKTFTPPKLSIGLIKYLSFPFAYYLFTWAFYLSVDGNAAIYPFVDFYNPFGYDDKLIYIILIDVASFISISISFITVYLVGHLLIDNRNKNKSYANL